MSLTTPDLLNNIFILPVRNALIIFALFSVIMAFAVVGTSVLMIVALRKVGHDKFCHLYFFDTHLTNLHLILIHAITR